MKKLNRKQAAERDASRLQAEFNEAAADADTYKLPQTVYRIDNADWPYLHIADAASQKAGRTPIVTVLPACWWA